MTAYLGPEWDEKVRRNREWVARYKARRTAGPTARREPRPHQFRARTDSFQAQIGRAVDGVLSRQAKQARAELRAMLAAGDRARAVRQVAADRALVASLDQALAARRAAEYQALIADLDAAAERAPKHRYFKLIDMTGGLS